jgi:Zn-dependent alcohol dehydrogenases
MSPLVAGLAPRGHMVVVGAAPDPISVNTSDLIFGTPRSVDLTGTSIENEDNLAFSERRGIHPMTETMPMVDAPKAYERMMSGQARFRIVLDMTV